MKRTLPPFLVLLLICLAATAYRIGAILHAGIDTYVDEAYYWGWAQDLDWGYYSKPPMVAALIAASTALFGDGLLAIKLPSLLLYPATALVLQRLGARLADERTGFWAGLLFLTLPLVSVLGLFVSTDAPLLFCWALGMLLLHDAIHRGGTGRWLLLGLVVGAGLMSKYTMAAFVGSAFLALLVLPRGQRALLGPGPWLSLLVAALCLAPNLWWNFQHDFPTFRHTAEITRMDRRGWAPGELGEFLGAQALSLGPLLSLLFLGALLSLRRLWGELEQRYLLAFALPLLILVCVQAATGRANGNWAAPVFVAVCVIVAWQQLQGRRLLWLGLALGVNVAGALATYHWADILPLAGKELSAKNDPYKRARGWRALSEAVAPHIAAHPGAIVVAPDRELLAQLDFHLRLKEKASWNPRGRVMDQYQLTTRLEQAVGRDVLFVARRMPDDVFPRFASHELLADLVIPVHQGMERRASVYLLRNFRGY